MLFFNVDFRMVDEPLDFMLFFVIIWNTRLYYAATVYFLEPILSEKITVIPERCFTPI